MSEESQAILTAAAVELAKRLSKLDQLDSLQAELTQLHADQTALREQMAALARRIDAFLSAPAVTQRTVQPAAESAVPSASPTPAIEPIFRESASGSMRSFQDLRTLVDPEKLEPVPVEREADRHALEAPRRPFVKSLPATDEELPDIEARCRLKADACRWAGERRRLLNESADIRTEIEPQDREIVSQAKQLPDCFLWMTHTTAPHPPNLDDWKMLAGCFDVLADAVSGMRKLLDEGDDSSSAFQQGVELLAEAQSAVRVAVVSIDGPPTDHDQARVFGWLKNLASNKQLFIRRFMRLDDPADPHKWTELQARVQEYLGRWDEGRRRITARKKALGRLHYKLEQLEVRPLQSPMLWPQIADDVDELVKNGMPPSNPELREMLIGHVDELPELSSMPMGFQIAIREIDRYLASVPPQEEAEEGPASDPSFDEVRKLLQGKSVVIIGGERRGHAAANIEKAFGLTELIWIDTRAHESTAGFEPYVARPEVAMVLLAIRWSSHSYGEVQDFCRTYGKPLVRLPGGYNPRQIAAQILEQCSERLTLS